MGRLETVIKDGVPVEDYTYGAVPYGTCTYAVNTLRGIIGRDLAYDDEEHLLSIGDTEYQYDLDGFLTSKTTGADTTTCNYSSRGELLNVGLPDGTAITYDHDPLGRRIAKIVDGTTVEKYLWEGLTYLLAVYDGADNLIMRFEYADGRMPVAVEKAGARYYLSYDQVGSLRVVADAGGNVIKEITYDTFGYILTDTNPSFEIPFGFAGGLHDRDTGLVRFGYRDYDPDVGRWTAKDPIGFAGGDTDLYGYVLNNPINLIDPYGLLSYEQNRQRRKSLNTGLMTKGVKTVAGVVVGSQIVKNLGQAGLGVTAGTIIKNRGAVPVLGITGTVVNLAATAIVKGVLVSGSFYAGIEAGSNIGAYFDTLVDDGSGFLGLSPEILESMGFGSGIPNSDPCEK